MSASIQDMYNNIKRFLENDVYFYTSIIIVVSILSFGLGRMSMQDVNIDQNIQKPKVVMTSQPASAILSTSSLTAKTQPIDNKQRLVASKNGTKYHLLTCPGAKHMSETNKIYFTNEADARASGYTRAKNCKF